MKKATETRKVGRPSKYNSEVIHAICKEIATTSKSLKKVCTENNEFPTFQTAWNWLNDKENREFLDLYTRAKESQADILADEIVEIADDGLNDTQIVDGQVVVNHDVLGRSRLRMDARKFLAAKLKPKKYSERVDLTTNNESINRLPDFSHLTFEQIKELLRGNE